MKIKINGYTIKVKAKKNNKKFYNKRDTGDVLAHVERAYRESYYFNKSCECNTLANKANDISNRLFEALKKLGYYDILLAHNGWQNGVTK